MSKWEKILVSTPDEITDVNCPHPETRVTIIPRENSNGYAYRCGRCGLRYYVREVI